jgi:hypothetical protein
MSKSLDDFTNIDKINLFVRSMNVGFRATYTESNNLSRRILSFKFLEEWNRTTLSKSA